jgi:intein/homing endonuclease
VSRYTKISESEIIDKNALRKVLTIDNPNYIYQKKTLGIDERNIKEPKEFPLYKEFPDGSMLIPRAAAQDKEVSIFLSTWDDYIPPEAILAKKPTWKKDKQLKDYQEKPCQDILDNKSDLIVAKCGSGKCIDASSHIWYNNTINKIGNIIPNMKPGDLKPFKAKIISKDLSSDFTSGIYRDETTEAYKINLDKGYSQISSPEHPIWCWKNGKIQFIKTKEINNKTWIPIVIGNRNWANDLKTEIPITVYKYDSKKAKHIELYSKTILLTEGLSYVFGCLVGDGSLNYVSNMGRNQLKFSSVDAEIINNINDICSIVFENYSIEKSKNRECDWIIDCPELAACIRYLKMDTLSINKSIPSEIISSGKSMVRGFLQGLFDTDGSALNNGYIEYCSASEELANDVHLLLLAHGILSVMKFRDNDKNGAYHIYISNYANKFYNDIGFRLLRKQLRQEFLPKTNNTNWKFYTPDIKERMNKAWDNANFPGPKKGTIRDKLLCRTTWNNYLNANNCPSINKLRTFIDTVGDFQETDEIFMNGEVIWLKVINKKKHKANLYDFVVPKSHSFVGNGIINHNTVMATYILSQIEAPTCVIVHQTFLAKQWQSEIATFTDTENVIMHNNKKMDKSLKADIVIATVQSLMNIDYEENKEFYDRFNLVVFDEVHTMGSFEFNKVIANFKCKRFGVTATPKRTDGFKSFKWGIGSRITEAEIRNRINSRIIGFNTKLGDQIDEAEFMMRTRRGETANLPKLINHIYDLEGRFPLTVSMVTELLKMDRHILLLTHRREYAKELFEAIDFDDKELLMGGKKVPEHHKQLVVATFQLMRIAFNRPRLDILINTGVYGAPNDVEQSTGRIERPVENKPVPIVIDLYEKDITDVGRVGMAHNMFKKRLKTFKELDCPLITDNCTSVEQMIKLIKEN